MGTQTSNSYYPSNIIINPAVCQSLMSGNYTYTNTSSNISSGFFTISGNSSAYGNWEPPAIPESQQRIEITFKDGGTMVMSLKDYTIFVALHGKSPSECTKQEYEELSFGERV